MVDGAPALIWAANFAGIEIHPWTSTAANPEQPVTHRWTGGTRAVSWEWHKSKRGDPFLALVGVEQVLPTL